MSTETNPTMSTPFPYYDPNEILSAMQNQTLNNSVTYGTSKVLQSLSDTNRNFTTEINNVGKDVHQSALGLRDAIERGNSANSISIERNGANGVATTERNGGNIMTAIERTSASGLSTTERNGGNIMTAIERVAGEGRLTTTISDAASRQAAADSARDILRAVDHNGASSTAATERNGSQLAIAIERNGANAINATQSNATTLLGTVERIAGEGRIQTLTSSGILDNSLRDVRHSILSDVNRAANDLGTGQTQSLNVLTKHVTDAAWEGRTAMSTGFQSISEEYLRTKNDLAQQASTYHTSNILENQKLGARGAEQYASLLLDNQKLAAHGSEQYSSLLMEQQKLKEYLSSKGDNQFAMNQLELQKVKEGLAAQASHHFASTQLEAQKNREAIQMQLADAKYEALKSQQYLTDKIGECCCEVKQKIDLIDRDRLRDNLIVQRDDNNLLKILELTGGLGGRGGYGGYGGDRGSRRRR